MLKRPKTIKESVYIIAQIRIKGYICTLSHDLCIKQA